MQSGGDGEVDINLTPLLDLVLQMVMFFMIVANFVAEQNSSDIQLPEATAAGQVLEIPEAKIIYLNIDQYGSLKSYPGTNYSAGESEGDENARPRTIKEDLQKIQQLLVDDRKFEISNRGQAMADKMVLVVRADAKCPVAQVDLVLRMAQNAGYQNFKLRAKQLH